METQKVPEAPKKPTPEPPKLEEKPKIQEPEMVVNKISILTRDPKERRSSTALEFLASKNPIQQEVQDKSFRNPPKMEFQSKPEKVKPGKIVCLDLLGGKREIPDPSNWTPQEVLEYFTGIFQENPKILNAITEKKIAGESIMLLTKDDCFDHFQLSLGNTINLYAEIVKLQSGSDDPTLLWRLWIVFE